MTAERTYAQDTSRMNAPMSGTNRTTVVGVFDDRSDAEDAVRDLRAAGFTENEIGFAMRDGSAAGGSSEITTDTGPGSGAATGAVTGGLIGGVLGALASLAIPGVGPVIAAGILGPLLGGVAAGAGIGAVGGGLIGGLVTTGVPEDEARYYDEEFRSGRAIVTVKAGNRYAEAEGILRNHDAHFSQESGGQRPTSGTTNVNMAGANTAQTARTSYAAADTRAAPTDTRTVDREGEVRVPEVEERLNVDKRETELGEVRVTKHVETERKTVPVELEREEVHVDRRDVAERPLQAGETAFQEGTIRVPVRGEEAVVSKEAVVTGEVVINKERTTEREQVSDTVRSTHVDVDKDLDREGQNIRSDWNTAMPRYRTSWQQRYASSGGRWEDYEPAYRFGYEMHNDPRFRGRRFDEVENDLRTEWSHRHANSPWERFKANVRETWEDVKH